MTQFNPLLQSHFEASREAMSLILAQTQSTFERMAQLSTESVEQGFSQAQILAGAKTPEDIKAGLEGAAQGFAVQGGAWMSAGREIAQEQVALGNQLVSLGRRQVEASAAVAKDAAETVKPRKTR